MVAMTWRERCAPVAGLLLIIASFLPWYGTSVTWGNGQRFDVTMSGWQYSWAWKIGLIMALVACGLWMSRPTQ